LRIWKGNSIRFIGFLCAAEVNVIAQYILSPNFLPAYIPFLWNWNLVPWASTQKMHGYVPANWPCKFTGPMLMVPAPGFGAHS